MRRLEVEVRIGYSLLPKHFFNRDKVRHRQSLCISPSEELLLAQEVSQSDFLEFYPGERSLVPLALTVLTARAHFLVRRRQHKKFTTRADACIVIGVAAAAEGHERERSRGGQQVAVGLGLPSLRLRIGLEHLACALLYYPYGLKTQALYTLQREESISWTSVRTQASHPTR